MKHKPLLLSLLIVFISGCGFLQPVEKATSTPAFTETTSLTSTPELTQSMSQGGDVTSQEEEFTKLILSYFNESFLNTVFGEYYPLEDSMQNLAHKGYFKWKSYDVDIRNFILRTNVRMSTANTASDLTGCGVVFRTVGEFTESIFIQQDGKLYYGAGDTNFDSGYYARMNNPAEFEMIIILNEKSYQAYIDGKRVLMGKSMMDPTSGAIGFAVQSGSDDDFGSQCNFTNNDLWAIKKK